MSDIVWGVRGGVKLDLCELENAPERQRKAPECPKAFVHDFSLGSTADNAYMLDFNVVTAVKRGYPPTSITWAYHGLRCRPVEVKYFFEVIRWQVTSFQMITGSSLIFFKFIWNILCLWTAQLRCWFQTDLGRENSATYHRQGRQLLLTHGHALLTIFMLWLVKIWQVSWCGRFMQHLESCLLQDSWSWQSFVSTCDVFNCLFSLDAQNEIQLLAIAGVFFYSWLVGFWFRNTSLVKIGIRFRMASFLFFTSCLMCKGWKVWSDTGLTWYLLGAASRMVSLSNYCIWCLFFYDES